MSEYVPRLTAPARDDLRWIQINSGGYNRCIYGSDGAPSVLPNCTGYVHGRWMELAGINTDTLGLAFTDATGYWGSSDASLARGSEPALGAVMCYSGGSEGFGHVAIVEAISDDGTYVVASESNYGTDYFITRVRYRNNDWSWYQNPLTHFQGFIYHPGISPEPPTPQPVRMKKILLLYAAYLNKKRGVKKNGLLWIK